jgi:hypothetical protein
MSETKTTSRTETCSTCRFWKRGKTDEFRSTPGQCRKHAPVLAVVTRDDGTSELYKFPSMGPTDWCGEWAGHPKDPSDMSDEEILREATR